MLLYSKVSIPLIKEFKTSFGTQKVRDALILILMEDGITAYGEVVTDEDPAYGYEYNYTALHLIKKYLGNLVNPERDPVSFNERAQSIRGHEMAKAAVEMMLWDFRAKKEKKPLHAFIGESKGKTETGISIGMAPIDDMLASVGRAVDEGYRRIKVKIERGYDELIIKKIREKFGDINLSVDANQSYTRDDFKILEKLDKYKLAYIEQPLRKDDLVGHAVLKKKIETPLCLDESIVSMNSLRNAIELDAIDILNIKPGRVGGISSSLEMMSMADQNGIGVWIGGMLETGIGRSFNISLASQKKVKMPGDTSPNSRYFKKDVTKEVFHMDRGFIKPMKGNGIGVELDYQYLKTVEVEGGRVID